MVDSACLIAILICIVVGFWRGLLLTLLAVVGLAASYMAAYLFYAPIGRWIGGQFELQPLISYPLGGLVVFACASIAVMFVGAICHRRLHRWRQRNLLGSAVDRLSGAVVGGALGLVFVGTIVLFACLFEGIGPMPVADFCSSRTGRYAGELAHHVAYPVCRKAGLSPSAASGAAHVIGAPDRAVAQMATLINDARLKRLWVDPAWQRAALAYDTKAMLAHPLLNDLARDSYFVIRAERLGLLPLPAEAPAGRQIPVRLVATLGGLTRTVHMLANDPETRALLAHPGLSDLIKAQDLPALANHPQFNQLVKRVFSQLRQQTQ